MYSIYGGTGIIGSYFTELYGGHVLSRDHLTPASEEVLYLISTTSNSYSNPLIHTNTNIDCLMRRLISCQDAGVKTFNFISSWFVYGPHESEMKESSQCNPQGLYSITKHCAEQLVIDFCSFHGINWRVLRLGNVYGGPDRSNGQRNALHYMVQELKENRPVQGVFGLRRDYMHIYDICRAIALVCKAGETNTIYNIASGHSVLQSDCILMCKSISNSTSHLSLRPHKSSDQSLVMKLDCNSLQSLGFSSSISLEEGLFDLCTNQKFSIPAHFSMETK